MRKDSKTKKNTNTKITVNTGRNCPWPLKDCKKCSYWSNVDGCGY